ncbi:hypothetical protein [Archaeoglobus sp.]
MRKTVSSYSDIGIGSLEFRRRWLKTFVLRTSRIEELKNNWVELSIVWIFFIVGLLGFFHSGNDLFKLFLILWLVHLVYWTFVETTPTTYEIDENGIRWKSGWFKGSASWDRVFVKFKGDMAEIHVKFAFAVVKKVALPKRVIKDVRKNLRNQELG